MLTKTHLLTEDGSDLFQISKFGTTEATLQVVLEHFGQGSLQRQLVASRLGKIYNLAKSTNQLVRFIIYGSFITDKPNPNDVDVFLVIIDDFDKYHFQGDVR